MGLQKQGSPPVYAWMHTKGIFKHKPQCKHQHESYPHVPPNYGQKIQLAKTSETAPQQDYKQSDFIQEVTSTFYIMPVLLTA